MYVFPDFMLLPWPLEAVHPCILVINDLNVSTLKANLNGVEAVAGKYEKRT